MAFITIIPTPIPPPYIIPDLSLDTGDNPIATVSVTIAFDSENTPALDLPNCVNSPALSKMHHE